MQSWLLVIVVLWSLSCVRLFMTPWIRVPQALLSSIASQSLVKFMSVASMTLSNHLILCRPLFLFPSRFPNIRVFSRESSLLMRWPKYWILSFRICPSSEHSGLISFRMDRFILLAVQGTLKSPPAPQIKSINPSAVSLLYGPALTSIYCYWKNHSFDYVDLCRQGDVSAF